MANLYSQFTYDDDLSLKAAGLVDTSAAESTVLDLGDGLFDGFLVVDVSAIEVATGDELYDIGLQGGNAVGFDDVNVKLGQVLIGADAGLETDDSLIGRYAIPIRNEKNGVIFRYVRINTVVSGTVATGVNFKAFLAKRS